MMSFRDDKLARMRWPNETVQLLTQVTEFKGRYKHLFHQARGCLRTLAEPAFIQSVESSNRIEGITISPERLLSLIRRESDPMTRAETEIVGYRDVLATIYSSAEYMTLKPSLLLQLHRDLLQHSTGPGGQFKVTNNTIEERMPTGESRVRFNPVPAWQTPQVIGELTQAFLLEREQGKTHDLLLTACFILDFLCIHPFSDGNGRISRLLTLLLLQQSDYEVPRYVSLERLVEETTDQYFESLERSSAGWHRGEHDLTPWVSYFLMLLLNAYQQFENKVGYIPIFGKGRG